MPSRSSTTYRSSDMTKEDVDRANKTARVFLGKKERDWIVKARAAAEKAHSEKLRAEALAKLLPQSGKRKALEAVAPNNPSKKPCRERLTEEEKQKRYRASRDKYNAKRREERAAKKQAKLAERAQQPSPSAEVISVSDITSVTGSSEYDDNIDGHFEVIDEEPETSAAPANAASAQHYPAANQNHADNDADIDELFDEIAAGLEAGVASTENAVHSQQPSAASENYVDNDVDDNDSLFGDSNAGLGAGEASSETITSSQPSQDASAGQSDANMDDDELFGEIAAALEAGQATAEHPTPSQQSPSASENHTDNGIDEEALFDEIAASFEAEQTSAENVTPKPSKDANAGQLDVEDDADDFGLCEEIAAGLAAGDAVAAGGDDHASNGDFDSADEDETDGRGCYGTLEIVDPDNVPQYQAYESSEESEEE